MKEKPWEAMYRALLRRLTEIAYPDDYDFSKRKYSLADLKVIVDTHNALMNEYDEKKTLEGGSNG